MVYYKGIRLVIFRPLYCGSSLLRREDLEDGLADSCDLLAIP